MVDLMALDVYLIKSQVQQRYNAKHTTGSLLKEGKTEAREKERNKERKKTFLIPGKTPNKEQKKGNYWFRAEVVCVCV